jgi:hypothetical protein
VQVQLGWKWQHAFHGQLLHFGCPHLIELERLVGRGTILLDPDGAFGIVPISPGSLLHNGWNGLVKQMTEVSVSVHGLVLPFKCPSIPVDTLSLCSNHLSNWPAAKFAIPGALPLEIIPRPGHSTEEHYLWNVAFVPASPVWDFFIIDQDYLLVDFL